jgi:hypothetical protein
MKTTKRFGNTNGYALLLFILAVFAPSAAYATYISTFFDVSQPPMGSLYSFFDQTDQPSLSSAYYSNFVVGPTVIHGSSDSSFGSPTLSSGSQSNLTIDTYGPGGLINITNLLTSVVTTTMVDSLTFGSATLAPGTIVNGTITFDLMVLQQWDLSGKLDCIGNFPTHCPHFYTKSNVFLTPGSSDLTSGIDEPLVTLTQPGLTSFNFATHIGDILYLVSHLTNTIVTQQEGYSTHLSQSAYDPIEISFNSSDVYYVTGSGTRYGQGYLPPSVNGVPEPSVIVLMGIGLLSLGIARKTKPRT